MQSNSFSVKEEKGPAFTRLSGSMYESHLSVYAASEHQQVSRDNSTESEEPPPTPKSPPPPLNNVRSKPLTPNIYSRPLT
ncbi:hypothetical protein E2C01_034577 [Portunus trituberculatus]|uniref:Uncharacterized protein n=1 Tax=Portunus trituberculatus TaxID=210409 RepID=A0A5B7F642_PORTR|nr:hypothetical protein [Portunus trituberculatus]